MIRATVLGLAALCAWKGLDSSTVGQPSATIRVRNLVLVSADVPEMNHAEPWLAIDPRNPARALAVAIVEPGEHSVAYRSLDGGVTRTRAGRQYYRNANRLGRHSEAASLNPYNLVAYAIGTAGFEPATP